MKRTKNHKPVNKNEENPGTQLLESSNEDANVVGKIIQNTEEEINNVKTDLRQYLCALQECKQKVCESYEKLNLLSSEEAEDRVPIIKHKILSARSSKSKNGSKLATPRTHRSSSSRSDDVIKDKTSEISKKKHTKKSIDSTSKCPHKKLKKSFTAIPENDDEQEIEEGCLRCERQSNESNSVSSDEDGSVIDTQKQRKIIKNKDTRKSREEMQHITVKRHSKSERKKSKESRSPSPAHKLNKKPCTSSTCNIAVCGKRQRSQQTKTVQTEFTVLPDLEATFKMYEVPEVPFPSTVDLPDDEVEIETHEPVKPEPSKIIEESEKKNQLAIQVLPALDIKRPLVTQRMPDVIIESNYEDCEHNLENETTPGNIQYLEIVQEDSKKSKETIQSSNAPVPDKKIQEVSSPNEPESVEISPEASVDKMEEMTKEDNKELLTSKKLEEVVSKASVEKLLTQRPKKSEEVVSKEPVEKILTQSPKKLEEAVSKESVEETKEIGKTISEELNLNVDDIPSVKTLKKIQYHLEQKCALIRKRLNEERNLQPGEYISLRWKLNQPPRWKTSSGVNEEVDENKITLLPASTNEHVLCDPCSSSKGSSEISLVKPQVINTKDNLKYNSKTGDCDPCLKSNVPCLSQSDSNDKNIEYGSVRRSNVEIELANVNFGDIGVPKDSSKQQRGSGKQLEEPVPKYTILEEPEAEIPSPKHVSLVSATKKEFDINNCPINDCSGKIAEKDVFADYITSGMSKPKKHKLKNLKCPKKICFKDPEMKKLQPEVNKPDTLEKETVRNSEEIEESNVKLSEVPLLAEKPDKKISDSESYCCKLKKNTNVCPEKIAEESDKKRSEFAVMSQKPDEILTSSQLLEKKTSVDPEENIEETNLNISKLPLMAEKPDKKLPSSKSYCCTLKMQTKICPEEQKNLDKSVVQPQKSSSSNNLLENEDSNEDIPIEEPENITKEISQVKEQRQTAYRKDPTTPEESNTGSRKDENKEDLSTSSSSEDDYDDDQSIDKVETETSGCNKDVCTHANIDVFSEYLTSGMSKSIKKSLGTSKCPKKTCGKTDIHKKVEKLAKSSEKPPLRKQNYEYTSSSEESLLENEIVTQKKIPVLSAEKQEDEIAIQKEILAAENQEVVTHKKVPVIAAKQEVKSKVKVQDNSAQTETRCELSDNANYEDQYVIRKFDAEYIIAKFPKNRPPNIKFLKDAEIQHDSCQISDTKHHKCQPYKKVKSVGTRVVTKEVIPQNKNNASQNEERVVNIDDYKAEYSEYTTGACSSKQQKCLSSSDSCSPRSKRKKQFKVKKCSTPLTSATTTTENNSDDASLSDGEVKLSCECSTSIGEIHLCHFANDIRKKTKQLKQNPERVIKDCVRTKNFNVPHRYKYYDNWVTYYVNKNNQTLSSGELGSESNFSSVTSMSQ